MTYASSGGYLRGGSSRSRYMVRMERQREREDARRMKEEKVGVDPNDLCGEGKCPDCGGELIIASSSSSYKLSICTKCNRMDMVMTSNSSTEKEVDPNEKYD